MNKQIPFWFVFIFSMIITNLETQNIFYKQGELLIKFKPGIAEKSILTESKFLEMNVKIKR